MKRKIVFLLLFSLLLTGCTTGVPAAESITSTTTATDATAPTEPSTTTTDPSTSPTEPSTTTTDPSTSPTEPSFPSEPDLYAAMVRAITDPAVMDHYRLTDLSNYSVYISSGPRGSTVRYTLCIGNYSTHESYRVHLDTALQIESITGEYGTYAQYLPYVTPEMITDAEEDLARQSAAYPEGGPIYMTIDQEGYLCLQMEVIHEYEPTTPGTSGCGIDHDHLFFTARICPKPD